jgi:hypothetical protein
MNSIRSVVSLGNAEMGAREVTLNERLTRALESILVQGDRIELFVSRVNGTVSEEAALNSSAPVPVYSLAQNVDRAEKAASVIAELVAGLDRIA